MKKKPTLCANGKPRDYRVFQCNCCMKKVVREVPQGSTLGYTPGRCGLCGLPWNFIERVARRR